MVTGINLAVSAAFTAYSLFMLIIGIWGYSSLPETCKELGLRTSLRTLIVTGAITLVAYISFGICQIVCRDENPLENIPGWIFLFTLIITINNLIAQAKIQQHIKDTGPPDEDNCYNSASDNISTFNEYGIATTVIIMVLCGFIYFRIIFGKRKEAHVTRERAGKLVLHKEAGVEMMPWFFGNM
jgi:amino acid transporter